MLHNAIILAAGVGSRLYPYTKDKPKCLLEVDGMTLLERTVKILLANNVESVIVATGYLHDQVENFFKEKFPQKPITCIPNPHYKTTNNAQSLLTALRSYEAPLILMDGDLLFDPILLKNLIQSSKKNVMVVDSDLKKVNNEAMKAYSKDGQTIFHLAKNLQFPSPLMGEGRGEGELLGEYIGMAKFDKDWVMQMINWLLLMNEGQQRNCYYEDAVNGIVSICPPLYYLETKNLPWTEIDTREDLQKAHVITRTLSEWNESKGTK